MFRTYKETTKQIPVIQLFDMQDGDLKPTIHCYSLPWLSTLMTDFPNAYMKAYKYIFYMTCPDEQLNVYVNTPEIDKSDEIIRQLQITEFMADDLHIENAVNQARKLYTTPTTEVYLAAKSMLEKLKRSFQVEELSWGGKDATGPALTAAMEKLPKLIQAYADSKLKLDQELKSRSRGGQLISDDIDDED